MKEKISALLCLILPPCSLKNVLLRLLGWEVGKNSRIGFSYVQATKIKLCTSTHIGHLNFIKIPCLRMEENSYIQNLNRIAGSFYLFMSKAAAIGNLNTIKRANKPVTWGKSILKIGEGSKITSRHILDCTRPIRTRKHSIIAGLGRQIWTHEYIHNNEGPERFRMDGSVTIGDNVYISSASVINPGVCIANAITVGSHSTIAKSLSKRGLYVSQSLRYIPFDYKESETKYPAVKTSNLIEKVLHKQCKD